MNTPPRGIPLRPDRSARAEAAVQSLVRACILRALAERGDRNMFAQREREWRDDYDLGLILRAAVGPASTDSAAALVTVAVALVSILTPVSAAAALLQRALPLTFEGSMGSISVPSISPPAVGFIAEGAPMPMLTAPTGPGATLLPYKLAASVSFTDEMLRGSNAEVVVRQALVEATGPALDSVLFSTAAATDAAPAGLLFGIASSVAITGGPEPWRHDVAALAAKVARVAAGPIVIVAAPEQANLIPLNEIQHTVLESSALPDGTVLAISTSALAAVVEAPGIDASKETIVHEADPALPIVSGTPANPVRSLWQTNSVALRLKLPVSWSLRHPGAIAWLQGAQW